MELFKNKRLKHILALGFFLFLVVGTVLILRRSSEQNVWQQSEGPVFGTFYEVKYQYAEPLDEEILKSLEQVDAACSIFNPESTISKVNAGDSTFADTIFTYALLWADKVSRDTHGAFDYTVAPLVNAWGFGFKTGQFPTEAEIDSLRQFVGYDKVYWEHSHERGGLIRRADKRTTLDFGGIAKGYGVDCVARMLELKGVKNYMVMVGGEVVVKGTNPEGKPWSVGVEEPVDDRSGATSEINKILHIKNDGAVATSGNYRNYYYHNGRKISHTIDPRTGHPAETTMLSASVFASTCMEADALATAFMVMGPDSTRAFLARRPDIRAYIIYNDNGERRMWASKGVE